MEVFFHFYEVELTTRNKIAQLLEDATNNGFHFRIWLKIHHSAQKISTIFSHLRRASCYFLYPHFSDESYAPSYLDGVLVEVVSESLTSVHRSLGLFEPLQFRLTHITQRFQQLVGVQVDEELEFGCPVLDRRLMLVQLTFSYDSIDR